MVEEFPLAAGTAHHTRALTVFDILNKDNFPDISMARIELNGVNDTVQNGDCGAFYMVEAGGGEFTFFREDGRTVDRVIRVKSGDSVFIPKGTFYRDQGKMTMYSVCNPAFDPDKVKIATKG